MSILYHISVINKKQCHERHHSIKQRIPMNELNVDQKRKHGTLRPVFDSSMDLVQNRNMIRIFIKFVTLATILASCDRQTPVDRSHEALGGLPNKTTILEINGKSITVADVDAQMKVKIEKARDQLITEYRTEALEHAYQRLLLEVAQKNGTSDVPTYLNNLKSKIEISDSEIKHFLKQNKVSTLSKEQARKFLTDQQFITIQNELKNKLLSEAKLEWKLLPTLHNISKSNLNLSKGSEIFTHRIDVFCDFTNLLCSQFRLGVEQILIQHPNDVHIFFHTLPRLNDTTSNKAAVASICAGQIHQFWKVYDAFFNAQVKLSTNENIDILIRELSFSPEDQRRLDGCIKSGEGQELLDSEVQLAKDNGIAESPALLLDGVQTKSIDVALEKLNLK